VDGSKAGERSEVRGEKEKNSHFSLFTSHNSYIRGVIGWRPGAIKRETGAKPVLFP
jgi:hypothetical protein